MYKNLKDYIARLEREGELVRIRTEVDPRLEVAELTDGRRSVPEGGVPCCLNGPERTFRADQYDGVGAEDGIGSRCDALG